jgi:dienelactone hydrolase
VSGRAVLAAIVVALPALALAVDPCSDVPSYPTFRCRVAQLNQQTVLADAKLKKLTRKLAILANDGAGLCTDGKTGPARRKLRKSRRQIARIMRELPRAAGRTGLPAVHRRDLDALVLRVDALERATDAHLETSDCPFLIQLDRPAPLEVVRDEIYLFATLDRRTDPGSVTAALFPAGRPGDAMEVPLAQRSLGTVWSRVACPAPGDWVVRVRARNGDALHTEEVTVRCGADDAVLGGDVDVLVLPDAEPGSIRIEPVRPLAGGATYAAVVTSALRAGRRRRAIASPAFRTAASIAGQPTRGDVVHYGADPGDPLNPFPDDRLRQPDGTITIPPGFTARAVPADAAFDGTRAFLGGLDGLCEEHHGFSPSAGIVVHLDQAPALKTAGPDAVRVVEVRRPAAAATPAALVDALVAERGLDRRDIALAFAFTIEALPNELGRIRTQIVERAAATPPVIDLTPGPAPADGRAFGVYRPGDPEFDAFFGGTPPPDAGVAARGTFPSPDYRVNGRIPEAFLDGTALPPTPAIDVIIVRPPDPVPAGGFPVVLLQHGFCGSNTFVTDVAEDFLAAGLAVAGISAPEHGLRGNCLDFFDFDDFNAFGNNFRQSTIDLLQLLEAVRAGVDLDDDGETDLAPDRISYLGVSLGGVIGGTFAAVEPRLVASVLNVPGGRLAQFAGSTSSLALPFLEQFAATAGVVTHTCGGAADGALCATDGDCAAGEQCLLTEAFAIMLDAALPDFQCQLDPGDPVTYARALRIAPPSDAPGRVLVQEGIGDVIVANPLTEALARAIGLAEQRADSSPQGTGGLWRFPPAPPPAEGEQPQPDGHSIFSLPEVRSQAVTFLASGGTELIAPPTAPAPTASTRR